MYMKSVLIVVLSLLLVGSTSAQVKKFFSPIETPLEYKLIAGVGAKVTMNQLRPVANIASYGVGAGGSSVLTGAGLSYQHLVLDSTAGTWNCLWSANFLAWYKTPINPTPTNSTAFAYGVAVGLLNNLVLVGVGMPVNPSGSGSLFDIKNTFATVGFGINFNNGRGISLKRQK